MNRDFIIFYVSIVLIMALMIMQWILRGMYHFRA